MTTLAEMLDRTKLALATIREGDPQPYMDLWANSPDVTLFGAWGTIEHGHKQLMDTFSWVGNRFTGGDFYQEDVVVYESEDLAYTVGFEQSRSVSVDGDAGEPMTIRVTQVYRKFDDEWMLVHRHADFPPRDPRPRD
jgi:ketosteroid isomerase-like protein